MAEIKTNPAVAKLLDHAAKSKTISYDEISDWLPEELVKSEAMNDVIALLESSGIEISEDGGAVPSDTEEKDESPDKTSDDVDDVEDSDDDADVFADLHSPHSSGRLCLAGSGVCLSRAAPQ